VHLSESDHRKIPGGSIPLPEYHGPSPRQQNGHPVVLYAALTSKRQRDMHALAVIVPAVFPVKELNMRINWYFFWTDRYSEHSMELSDKNREEAMEIARSFGWGPRRWYDPRTWSNYYIEG
jgi:hypothetical protein